MGGPNSNAARFAWKNRQAVATPAARIEGEASLPLWDKLRIPWALRAESAASARISDLKLAASFVRSIETQDASLDLEIRRIARRIEDIAGSLAEQAENADRT